MTVIFGVLHPGLHVREPQGTGGFKLRIDTIPIFKLE
jgi:hypothetical protein